MSKGREIIIHENGTVTTELDWLNDWKKNNKKEVRKAIKFLQRKNILITDENINNEILEPYIHKGMRNYGGTGQPSTTNIVRIDYFKDWEKFIREELVRIGRTKLQKKLKKVLKKLKKKEAKIIAMRYGLGKHGVTKLKDIAEEFNTKEINIFFWVKRIVKRMIKIVNSGNF